MVHAAREGRGEGRGEGAVGVEENVPAEDAAPNEEMADPSEM